MTAATRRRGLALEAALLDAAWEELRAVGYRELTIEAVAARAGTSRAVLYRRWRGRGELVIAALRRHRPMLSAEVPDTGSLRGDVLTLLRRISARLVEVGPDTVYGLLADHFAEAEPFTEVQRRVLRIGTDVMTTILERAADRGEARRDLHPRVVRLPTDLFRHELFVTRTPPAEATLRELVDHVFLPLVRVDAGGRPGGPVLGDRGAGSQEA